jgi:hypothetical protein
VFEFPLPDSCLFFLEFLPPCNIFLNLWLLFAIGSIHQEAQAVKFNCSCTSGFTDSSCLLSSFKFNCNCTSGLVRLQLSSSIFSSSIVTVLPDYSGYNCFLRFLNFQLQQLLFSEFLFDYQNLITLPK